MSRAAGAKRCDPTLEQPISSVELCELTIDMMIFRARNRKCFCLLDMSAASGLHWSYWV